MNNTDFSVLTPAIVEQVGSGSKIFSKRNIAFLIIFFIVVIVVGVLTSIFFLGINFQTISKLQQQPLSLEKSPFLIGLIFSMLYYWMWNIITIWFNSRAYGVKASFWDWLIFGITSVFITGITPFSLGNEPYRIYWLTRHGLTSRNALLVVSSTSVYWTLVQIIVTWPSFIIVSTHYQQIASSQQGIIAYWFSLIGMLMDIAVFLIFFTVSYSRRVHVFLGRILNKILKLLKRPYKTVEQLYDEYQTQASFKTAYIAEMKRWKHVVFQLIGVTGLAIINYFSVYFAIQLLNTPIIGIYDVQTIFNIANVAISANNFVPIPGGEGTIQIVLREFLLAWNSGLDLSTIDRDQLKTGINTSIFVWRAFNFYLLTTLGLLFFPIVLYQHFMHVKNKNINSQNVKLGSILNKSFDKNNPNATVKTVKEE